MFCAEGTLLYANRRFAQMLAIKLDKVIGQATVFPGGLYSSAFGLFMNEAKWNGLPAQDQALITRFGGEYLARRAGKRAGIFALRRGGGGTGGIPRDPEVDLCWRGVRRGCYAGRQVVARLIGERKC